MAPSDVVVGLRAVMEVLRAGQGVERVLVSETRTAGVDLLEEWARRHDVPFERAPEKTLDAAAGGAVHQGVLAYVTGGPPETLRALLERAEASKQPPFLALLDGIEDVHNLGAIIRSADAAGIHGVVVPQRRAASVTAGVHKTSAGATSYVPVVTVSSLAQAVDTVKRHGIHVVGAAAEGAKDLWEANLRGPLAFVIGSEHAGLSRLVAERCDELVRIPMKGGVSSLNASVAAAVLFFEKVRQDQAAARAS